MTAGQIVAEIIKVVGSVTKIDDKVPVWKVLDVMDQVGNMPIRIEELIADRTAALRAENEQLRAALDRHRMADASQSVS